MSGLGSSGGPVLVHLGAGQGDVSGYRLPIIDFAQRFLVEAEPGQFRRLSKAYANDSRVQLFQQILGVTEQEVVFTIYSLPQFNSTEKPRELLELYPGLKVTKEVEDVSVGVDGFIESLGLTIHPDNTLVVEATGLEPAILQVLSDKGLLSLFPRLGVTVSDIQLYEGSWTAEEVSAFITKLGYEDVSLAQEDSSEVKSLTFYRNQVQVELKELKEQVASLTQERLGFEKELKRKNLLLSETEGRNDLLEKQRQDLTNQLEHQKNEYRELELRLHHAQQGLEETNQQLQALRQSNEKVIAQKQELVVHLTEAENKATLLEEQHKTINQKLSQVEDTNKALGDKAQALTLANQALEAKVATLDTQLANLHSEREALAQKTKQLDARLLPMSEAQTTAEHQLADQLGLVKSLRAQVKELTKENTQLKSQVSVAQEQITRAEGQIGVIKDLLIREKQE